MKICNINQLIDHDFNFTVLNTLRQYWHNTKFFSCMGTPKNQNLLLFLDGCKITYTTKNHETVTACSGDIVYTPIGSEYTAKLSDFQTPKSHTVGINFLLSDPINESLILSDDIMIFHTESSYDASLLFHRLLAYDTMRPHLRTKITFGEILCLLASNSPQKNIPEKILTAINYLSEHIEECPSISTLASLCNISEVSFRKQFKACTKTTPAQYRTSLRLKKAQTYLEYGDVSVQEISDMLGYATVSHFIKEFRTHYELSPLQYRKQKKYQ